MTVVTCNCMKSYFLFFKIGLFFGSLDYPGAHSLEQAGLNSKIHLPLSLKYWD